MTLRGEKMGDSDKIMSIVYVQAKIQGLELPDDPKSDALGILNSLVEHLEVCLVGNFPVVRGEVISSNIRCNILPYITSRYTLRINADRSLAHPKESFIPIWGISICIFYS